ncbi:DUF6262 family protein [Microbacterium aerolatum]|uniref:DUF6262 family protein n=1 Tax=Microbacterium aerolatum TaxID=153731 RepID=UPI002000E676|nr:DUF6262 family protein [Microbacterium aerolatum]MCK3768063.1 DUF6262 family protein [Microbacterium aerolatum]
MTTNETGRAGNPAALAAARAETAQRKHRAVLTALDRAEERGTPLTVSGLAAQAGVSRQFLYSRPDLIKRLRRHQDQHPGDSGEPLRAARTADLIVANDTIRRLKHEIRQLTGRLDAGLAAQVELRDETRLRELYEQRGHELTRLIAQNADLGRIVEQLRETVRSLEDDLAVERAALRALASHDDNVTHIRAGQ